MGAVLLSVLVFTAVTLGITAGYRLVAPLLSREGLQVSRRLRGELRRAAEAQGPEAVLFKNPDRLTLDSSPAAGPNPAPAAARPGAGVWNRLAGLLEECGVRLTPQQFLTAAGGLGVALGVLGGVLVGPLFGVAAASAGAAALPVYVHARRAARREKMLAQLPNAFSLMARVLKSGHSVPQAMQAVADGFDGPLSAEFTRCQKQQSLGIRPEVTFHEMAQRTGILEVRIFVTAMLVQRQTGGNLSEMLDRLAGLIRERLRLRKQVRTLTAEGRLQGLTLIVLPFVVFGALWFINRKYAAVLLDHPSLLLATAAVMAIGVLWIRRIINFDI